MENEKFKKFAEKIENLKKEHRLDLSRAEDLTIAIMNLLSLEEHFFSAELKPVKKNTIIGLIK